MAVTARLRSVATADLRWDVSLLGLKNELNTVFTTPEDFRQDTYMAVRVFYNGQRLRVGVGNDYLVSESGGPGTGYDTITLLGIAPHTDDNLTADYAVDL